MLSRAASPVPMVAALYVQPNGCYAGIDGVDPWPESRDARTYAGPWPVVAHPPCDRWGNFYSGGPWWHARGLPPKRLGDDAGCFAAALSAVRSWGGVLEHPAGSRAWRAFKLMHPPVNGGWVPAGDWTGWTCCVEQGHYGHRARKATWLYVVGSALPLLMWGPSVARLVGTTTRTGAVAMMGRRERAATPLPFRDLLLSIARSCEVRQ